MKQNMCPVCAKPFQPKELIIKVWEWNEKTGITEERLGHLDCMLYISLRERREHPPLFQTLQMP